MKRVGVILALVAGSFVVASTPAMAGSSGDCAQRIFRDWRSDGRVDRVYRLDCYDAALRGLPEDVLQYSSAADDISRALLHARRGQADPGDGPEVPAASADGRARDATARPTLVASPAARGTDTTGLPYPLLALAVLAATLMLSGGAAAIGIRRRRRGPQRR